MEIIIRLKKLFYSKKYLKKDFIVQIEKRRKGDVKSIKTKNYKLKKILNLIQNIITFIKLLSPALIGKISDKC